MEAFERFDLPKEIYQLGHQRSRLLRDIYTQMQKWFDPD
jgi:hypothetical protein